MDINRLSAYELKGRQTIKELETEGYILKHKKTGARVVIMENNDDNKVFYIGFRTPPKESTGVMHILEHSVLCGSKKYPVKDPFIELAKGSLNTFLNAMTYPDKTVYPVASCNDKDFQNLMNIYLDAVFYPNILNSDMTFRQEGWHYELPDSESELTINGVVYSEMKGAFSSPDDVLEREIFNSLFPDTPYSEESGGDPKVIPELTYEHYIEIYKKYYHPSNSYIYLYGNMDFVEKLDFIDREYLSNFDALLIDSSLPLQKPFEETNVIYKEYSITDAEPVNDNSYLSYNVAMTSNLDSEEYIAWQVIDYALCTAPGAVLRQMLIDAGIGKDVYSQYDNGVKQPYFSIVAKMANASDEQAFVKTIDDVLAKIVREGFDRDTLKAGLNGLEFRYREADFGHYPPGLMYGLQALDSWLYDDDKPFIHIEADATFKSLREKIDSDYYEKLLQKGLIENTHKSRVIVTPKIGLVAEEDEALKEKLAKYKASLSKEEIDKLVEDTKILLAYQEEEDSPESLQCIPVLEISDIKKEAEPLTNDIRSIDGYKVIYHPIHTNGIDYARVIFRAERLPANDFKYIGLLKNIMGLVDTKNYSYQELFNKIFIETGGLQPVINEYATVTDPDNHFLTFEWKGKCLEGDLGKVFELFSEIICSSKFDDEKRLLELINELKSRSQSGLISSGHLVAIHRALSYISKSAAYDQIYSGLEGYRLVEDIDKNFDDRKGEVIAALTRLCSYIFVKDNLMFDFAGSEEEYKIFEKEARAFIEMLPVAKERFDVFVPELEIKNEGFTSSSQVQYVCRAGNFCDKGLEYTGSLKALKVIMGYDYLWNNVRVKGGAYGCMSGFGRDGDSYFVSYRDPNLTKTIEVFEGVLDYIRNFEVDDRSMTQYIIGAISSLDTPLTPSTRAVRSMSAYMRGLTEEMIQKERDELLQTDCAAIKALLPYLEALLDSGCLCVVGNEEKINSNKKIFMNIKPLYNV